MANQRSTHLCSQRHARKSRRRIGVGRRVFWNDPDGLCSGPGKVVKISGEVISIAKDDLGEVEAFRHELRLLKNVP